MLLTKIWGSLLAFLAAAFLAGMFLLSLGNRGGFTDADKAAIRAVTEAGLAALRAEISASAVQRAPLLLLDPRLEQALAVPMPEGDDPDAPDLDRILAEVAEDNQFGNLKITVGLVSEEGSALAAHPNEKLLEDAITTESFRALNSTDEALFSATLGGQVHVVKVTPATQTGHRLLAIQMVDTGAGSSLRRVLGTQTPAGLVLNGQLTGEIIGDLQIGGEIEALAQAHGPSTPEQGASETFRVGEGLNARIGALGRVPGPAGQGADAVMLAVLSRNTAAAGQRDLATALETAIAEGQLERLQWPVLAAILILGLALALYLPQFEAVGPLQRLAQELVGVAEGSRHQVFQERYSGPVGEVARAANAAQEAIHAAYLSGHSVDDSSSGADASASRSRPRTARVRRPTRSMRRATGMRAAISTSDGDGPSAAESAELEASRSSSRSERPGRAPSSSHSLGALQLDNHAPPERDAPSDATASISSGALAARATPPDAVATSAGSSASLRSARSGLGMEAPLPRTSVPPPPRASASASTGSRPPPPPRIPTGAVAKPAASAASHSGASLAAISQSALRSPTPSARPSPAARPPSGPGASGSSPTLGSPPLSAASNTDAARAREIYEEFVQVKLACGEPIEGFTFEKFAVKLQKNREQLRQRPGVKDVHFTVYVKDGRAALKAKIVKE